MASWGWGVERNCCLGRLAPGAERTMLAAEARAGDSGLFLLLFVLPGFLNSFHKRNH